MLEFLQALPAEPVERLFEDKTSVLAFLHELIESKDMDDSVHYDSLLQKIRDVSETLLSVAEAQKEHGSITDDRAKNVVALYGALLSMNERAGADPADAVRNAGYVVYAYLGGQAKREITYTTE